MVNTERSTGISGSRQRNHLPAYKVGKLWKFKISEVDDWIRSGGAADEKGEEKAE